MAKSTKTKRTTTNKVRHRGSFSLRWKSGLVIVAVVALVGILIVRLSHASLPPEALADKTEQLLPDGRYKVSVPSLGYEKIFDKVDVAHALADTNYKNKLYQQVLDELEKIYNQKHQTTQQNTSPNQSGSTSDTSASPNSSSATPTSTTNLPGSNGGQISTQDPSLAAVQSTAVDSQSADSLSQQSGVIAFTFDKSKSAGAKTAKVYMDRNLIMQFSARQNSFNIDTTRYPNGEHRIDVVLIADNGSEVVHFAYPFVINNRNSIFQSFRNTITYPWSLLFGQ